MAFIRHHRAASASIVGALLFASISPEAGDSARAVLGAQREATLEELFRDKVAVVDGADEGSIDGLVIFEQSRESVMRLLRQSGRQIEFRSEVAESATLSTFDNGTLERQRLRYLLTDIIVHMRYEIDTTRHRIRWSLDPAFENDLKRASGFWELYALSPRRTLGRVGTLVDAGIPVPRFIQKHTTRRNLDDARRWVDSGGTWRP
jgi:hypothetical protein